MIWFFGVYIFRVKFEVCPILVAHDSATMYEGIDFMMWLPGDPVTLGSWDRSVR